MKASKFAVFCKLVSCASLICYFVNPSDRLNHIAAILGLDTLCCYSLLDLLNCVAADLDKAVVFEGLDRVTEQLIERESKEVNGNNECF